MLNPTIVRGLVKRAILVLLAPMWLAIPPFINRMIAWHAKMIGGQQYFDHMGVRAYISTLYFLMVMSVCIAASLLLVAITNRFRASWVSKLTLAFTVAALIAYLPAFTNGMSLLQTPVFPFQMKDEVFSVLGLALGTMVVLVAVSSSEDSTPRDP